MSGLIVFQIDVMNDSLDQYLCLELCSVSFIIGIWIITDQLYVCMCYKHDNMHRVIINNCTFCCTSLNSIQKMLYQITFQSFDLGLPFCIKMQMSHQPCQYVINPLSIFFITRFSSM